MDSRPREALQRMEEDAQNFFRTAWASRYRVSPKEGGILEKSRAIQRREGAEVTLLQGHQRKQWIPPNPGRAAFPEGISKTATSPATRLLLLPKRLKPLLVRGRGRWPAFAVHRDPHKERDPEVKSVWKPHLRTGITLESGMSDLDSLSCPRI